jgi:isocitrate/isopropylmalate dehydrogenase
LAPDIAGKGLANPIAMLVSFAMALRYSFAMGREADLVDQAIAAALAGGCGPPPKWEPQFCRSWIDWRA